MVHFLHEHICPGGAGTMSAPSSGKLELLTKELRYPVKLLKIMGQWKTRVRVELPPTGA